MVLGRFGNLPFWQHIISTTCHFGNIPFKQHATLPHVILETYNKDKSAASFCC